MSLATRQSGTLLSILSLCSTLIIGGAASAVAQPVIPVAPGRVQLTFDGIGDPRTGGAISPSLIKLGQLQSSPGSVLADGSVCPEGGRLSPTGITVVCAKDAGLMEWYKKVLAGTTDRKSGSVIYLDRAGAEVLRTYTLFECYPTAIRKYEGGDCDDADESVEQIQVEFSAKAIRAIGKHKGDYLPAHNFKLEIDGCVSGGTCPGIVTDGVTGLELNLGAACLAKGEQPGALKTATGFSVFLSGGDDCDDLCDMFLRAQGKPVPPSPMRATISTTRSNIKNHKSVELPPTVLNIEGAQIRCVTFPTFQVVPKPPATAPTAIEKIEIAVEKVERA